MVDVKICGIRTEADLAAAARAGARWVGMVFFEKSPRHLTLEEAALLRQACTATPLECVALTVNADDAMLEAVITAAAPKMIQCHGSESPGRLSAIKSHYGVDVMKAIRVEGVHSLDAAYAYDEAADWMLFDSAPAPASVRAPAISRVDLPGGTGHRFDWGLMRGWQGRKPWMLAGGLTAANVAAAIAASGAEAVDVSSHVESSPGIKDHAAIEGFAQAAICAK